MWRFHSAARFAAFAAALLVCTVSGAAPAGPSQQPTILSTDLPRRPELACDTPAAVTAIARCGFVGSDAAWTRFLPTEAALLTGACASPPVLYQAISRASSMMNLDLLGLLRKCRAQHSNFSTQWDGAVPTGCPSMPMDVDAVSLAPQLGAAALVSRDIAPHWAWANLLQLGYVVSWRPAVYDIIDDIFGIQLVQIMMAVFTALPFVYLGVDWVLLMVSGVYRALPQHLCMVTAQHGVYAVILTLQLVPQTYLSLVALFQTWTGSIIATRQLTFMLGLFVTPRFSLYVMEAASRAVLEPNGMLFAQRVLCVATGVAVVVSKNTAVLAMALLMDLGIVFKAPLYATLVTRRLQCPVRFTRGLLRGSVAVYVVTRIFQLVVLVYMVASFAGMPDVRTRPEFIILSVAYLAYSVASVVTVVLYHRMDAKLGAAMLPDVVGADSSGSGRHMHPWFCCSKAAQHPAAGHHKSLDPLPEAEEVVVDLTADGQQPTQHSISGSG